MRTDISSILAQQARRVVVEKSWSYFAYNVFSSVLATILEGMEKELKKKLKR